MKSLISLVVFILMFINMAYISYAKDFDITIITKMEVVSKKEIDIIFNKSIANEPIDIEVYDINQNIIPLESLKVYDYDKLTRNKIVLNLQDNKINKDNVFILFKSVHFMDGEIINQTLKDDLKFVKEKQKIEVPIEILDSIKKSLDKSTQNLKQVSNDENIKPTNATKNIVNNNDNNNTTNLNSNNSVDNSNEQNSDFSLIGSDNLAKNNYTSEIKQENLPKTGTNENILIMFSFIFSIIYFFKKQKGAIKI